MGEQPGWREAAPLAAGAALAGAVAAGGAAASAAEEKNEQAPEAVLAVSGATPKRRGRPPKNPPQPAVRLHASTQLERCRAC